MTEAQWAALEQRIEALLDSHADLREANHKLTLEKHDLLERNAELRKRLHSVIERIKRLDMETDA